MTKVLEQFHPLISQWFTSRFAFPTDVQSDAWKLISQREHVLVSAPTGSGKTLTAFLWGINQFADGSLSPGGVRILYVSPLKALNNDVSRNLVAPVSEIRQLFNANEVPFPTIRIATRSGDTESSERRRMIRNPPEILITTPESLNLLLSSAGGQSILGGISTLILDEIHNIAGNKRGTYLMTAVERLNLLSGEFQRIALSATVKPLERIAAFIGGYQLDDTRKDYINAPQYALRKVKVVQSRRKKKYDISVRWPDTAENLDQDQDLWDVLADDFRNEISGNRSTLIFANSRALCEKLTLKINAPADTPIAYAHHGSLSREIRLLVEAQLKDGNLPAIVATSSLELGIDIGTLDEVLLVQAPPSISSTVQKIGRAGHQVGSTSKAVFYPAHAWDFVQAAVLADAVCNGDIESTEPVRSALDVLSQVIVSMVGMRNWDPDELYVRLRTSYPYHNLPRTHFDLVLNMLAGRYADTRIRELKPRINIDRLDNILSARKGALTALYFSGGVIPNRGYYQLRHEDSNARIGDLDEEFVWEARIGKVFTFGTGRWQISRITHNDVFVRPATTSEGALPFWRSESLNRDFHFSEKIGRFLEDYENDPQTTRDRLTGQYRMEKGAAAALTDFLHRQREHTGAALPHRHHLLIEQVNTGIKGSMGIQLVLHTCWGGQVNRPFATALEAAWQETYGERVEIFTTNEVVVLQIPSRIDPERLLALIDTDRLEELLKSSLESSGFFGARFRECAGRALLISKGRFGERKPLWMSRLQSQQLLDATMKFEDFPILLESWRSCLSDEFDLPGLRQVLGELRSGEIRWSFVVTTSPSPMAGNQAFEQINQYMYMDDSFQARRSSNVSTDLIQELLQIPGYRPGILTSIVAIYTRKLQRTYPGYSPSDATELLEWLKTRVLIPQNEWRALIRQINIDTEGDQAEQWLLVLQDKITELRLNGIVSMVALENLPGCSEALTRDRFDVSLASLSGTPLSMPIPDTNTGDLALINLVESLLQFYGPIQIADFAQTFGLPQDDLHIVLSDLKDRELLVQGQLIQESEALFFCDQANYSTLLRINRRQAIPQVDACEIEHLTPFLRAWQSRAYASDHPLDQMLAAIEQLRCFSAKPELWESELLPARVDRFDTYRTDQIFQANDLFWVGSSDKKISLCFTDDLAFLGDSQQHADDSPLPDREQHYDLPMLLDSGDRSTTELITALWASVWQGQISNDQFASLRKGIDNKYSAPKATELQSSRSTRRQLRRGSFRAWQNASSYSGHWFHLPLQYGPEDDLEALELGKERARVLLDRYGIVFKELLLHEPEAMQWRHVFRALRIMELSGEVLSGYFFKAIPGPQFIDPLAFRLFLSDWDTNIIYWVNATDPISSAGVDIPDLKQHYPRRLASNHLVYQGKALVLVSENNGKRLQINRPPDDPNISSYWTSLRHLLYRSFQPLREITILSINGTSAHNSPYYDALATSFDAMKDHRSITIRRSYQVDS